AVIFGKLRSAHGEVLAVNKQHPAALHAYPLLASRIPLHVCWLRYKYKRRRRFIQYGLYLRATLIPFRPSNCGLRSVKIGLIFLTLLLRYGGKENAMIVKDIQAHIEAARRSLNEGNTEEAEQHLDQIAQQLDTDRLLTTTQAAELLGIRS